MYRTIDASFWTDSKVRKLDVNGRLLFLYLITNPHTHVSGLYYLPFLIAQHETGMSAKQLKYSMDTLSSFAFCRFDPANELVWVVKMFRFQGRGEKNTLSAARHISNDIHNSFLISEFLEAYPEVKPHVKYRVSTTVSEFGTPHSPFPITEQDTGTQRTDSARKTSVPAELPISDSMRLWAKENEITVDLEAETLVMLDHYRGKGERRLDWIATWRTWMRNSKKFGGKNGKRTKPAEDPNIAATRDFLRRSMAHEVQSDIPNVRQISE